MKNVERKRENLQNHTKFSSIQKFRNSKETKQKKVFKNMKRQNTTTEERKHGIRNG